ncbi:MAG: glucose-6-phosphate isomerase [Bacteroidales bacterium]|jgi:glucose-6-phosphate isomerase|nr:glucose-6-phosphate isomerase [Bacteroidales bacterium]
MKIKTSFSFQEALSFVSTKEIEQNASLLTTAYKNVINKTGKGNDFLGWLDLPDNMVSQMATLKRTALQLAAQSEVVVVVGIGGSYLGARAIVEMLNPYFSEFQKQHSPTLLFAGNHLSEEYLQDLIEVLQQKDYLVIVVSKSGTTTEPAIAFRILKEHCEKKYGKTEAAKRIVAITDSTKGALKKMATQKEFQTFVIPDNVGGRYSVLTPVGLLPVAVAGFDIEKILKGAADMKEYLYHFQDFSSNIALQYALLRFLFYQQNKKMELMVAYEPKLFYLIEWFKQLFGESEGKEHKGIFPTGALFTTDLHSLGQYIQEGERMLFETVISVENSHGKIAIPHDDDNLDELNYLIHRTIDNINHIAETGTRMAHVDGGVPNLKITIPAITEEIIGELIYFFEFTCAVSGYLLDVNPFDQPGVEAYKKNMFTLLGK